MRIASQSTIAAIEDALIKLSASSSNEPLKLPTHLRHLVGGAEVALVQLIMTWAQRSQTRTLQTFINSSEGDQILDFVRRLSGLVAALCADEITDQSSAKDLSDIITMAALERLSALSGTKPKAAYRGSSIEVVCVDHIGMGTPYLLYRQNPDHGYALRSRENFRMLAEWMLKISVPKEYRGALPTALERAIGGMLYEVFKNTEEHGLVDASGDFLSKSVRVLKTSRLDIIPENLAQIVEGFSPLSEYCATLSPPDGAAQTHFFELSVLDSGPGFAPSWTGRALEDLTPDEEEQAVRECFEQGSAKGGGRFGEGLPHVLRLLSQERGFLRLRTGRQSFYVNYADGNQLDTPNRLTRFDPPSAKLAEVAGSLLTIIVPLRR